MNHSARRANKLAKHLGARRYLEIGVNTGAKFLKIEIEERTGVDPRFAFDFEQSINERTRLIPLTSDRFFATEPLLPPYDMVFIDGLHTFEQVVRDFANTLLRTHSRSVVVLDDTFPSDVYSALRDPNASVRFRKAAGGDGHAWSGDVFKIVFYIHDFWPSLNYRTITGSGTAQTLVWRANGIVRPPLFNNLERISRLTYFDLHEHSSVLQPASEDDAIALCAEQLKAL
jgi:hypothetical protein